MQQRHFPWPAILALVLGLGALAPVTAPRALAADDEEDQGSQKKIVRVITRDDPQDAEDAGAGYLGVQVQDMTRSLQRAMDLQGVEGALVNRVETGSPAERAGIEKGDVIVQLGRADTPSAEELTAAVRDLKPGAKTSVVVLRDGSRKTLTVVVGSRPKSTMYEVPDVGDVGPGSGMQPGMLQDMMRNRDEMHRQMEELKDQISRLADEIRELRRELARRPIGQR